MLKECVVLNGKVINIGPWDYRVEEVEVTPAVVDEETKEVVVQAVTEMVVQNPLPIGSSIETRDFEYTDDKGWYEVGYVHEPSLQERLEIAEQALLALMEVKV